MHGYQHMITDVLKTGMGFEGFVLSDWKGYRTTLGGLGGYYAAQVQLAINAGLETLIWAYKGHFPD